MTLIEIKGLIVDDETANYESSVLMTSPSQVRTALESEPSQDVDVYINSGGGFVLGGSEIYSILRESGKTIHVKIVGLAGSAASVIACAGDEVSMSPSSFIMIHNAYTDGENQEKMLSTINDSIVNVYSLKTGLPRDELYQMMSDETWMSAGKAIELGFADNLMFEDDQALVALIKGDKYMSDDEKKSTPTPKEGVGTNEALDVLKSIDKHLGVIEERLPEKKEEEEKEPESEEIKKDPVNNSAKDILQALFG